MYKVYYLNVYQTSFSERDNALDWIIQDSTARFRSMADYEILDGSDFL